MVEVNGENSVGSAGPVWVPGSRHGPPADRPVALCEGRTRAEFRPTALEMVTFSEQYPNSRIFLDEEHLLEIPVICDNNL